MARSELSRSPAYVGVLMHRGVQALVEWKYLSVITNARLRQGGCSNTQIPPLDTLLAVAVYNETHQVSIMCSTEYISQYYGSLDILLNE